MVVAAAAGGVLGLAEAFSAIIIPWLEVTIAIQEEAAEGSERNSSTFVVVLVSGRAHAIILTFRWNRLSSGKINRGT